MGTGTYTVYRPGGGAGGARKSEGGAVTSLQRSGLSCRHWKAARHTVPKGGLSSLNGLHEPEKKRDFEPSPGYEAGVTAQGIHRRPVILFRIFALSPSGLSRTRQNRIRAPRTRRDFDLPPLQRYLPRTAQPPLGVCRTDQP